MISRPWLLIEVLNSMDLSVRKNDLLRELHLFQGIVERKNTIPILANVLLEATGEGNLQLLATDLEVGLRSHCEASITKQGSLTLPAKKIYEIVRALPETEIRITEDSKGAVKLSADSFSSRIQTLPKDDFPKVAEPTAVKQVSLPRDVLRTMVLKTYFAITGEDTRYFLNGALFILKDDSMSLVATDGHRLALTTTARNGEGEEEARVILPKKTLLELSRLLSEGDGDVKYECGDNHLFFIINSRQLVSRKIDAEFPAYERVVPSGNDRRIEFDRDRLTSAIKRVALLSSDRLRAVKLNISTDVVKVTSSSPEVGEAVEPLTVEYKGEPLQICFNAQYVLDFLNVVDTDSIALKLKDEMSQAVMHPAGAESDYTYVIMPMRV